MTTEREKIQAEIDDLICQGQAIVEEGLKVKRWGDRNLRPLEVHREAKRIAKETGQMERIVALNLAQSKMHELIGRHDVIKARLLELDRALIDCR